MDFARAVAAEPAAPAPPARPALRAVTGDDHWAGSSDREMMEATAASIGLVAGKWKIELLYLLAAGVRRHHRLNDHLVVSKKVLSQALKALERDGLVRRSVFDETPVRIEYSLTPLGRSLTGPLFALCEWAEEHLADVAAAREAYDRRIGEAAGARDDSPRFTAAFQVRAA
jgi:DNA-binding HxlR family transcriptional regulator